MTFLCFVSSCSVVFFCQFLIYSIAKSVRRSLSNLAPLFCYLCVADATHFPYPSALSDPFCDSLDCFGSLCSLSVCCRSSLVFVSQPNVQRFSILVLSESKCMIQWLYTFRQVQCAHICALLADIAATEHFLGCLTARMSCFGPLCIRFVHVCCVSCSRQRCRGT